MAKDKPMQEVRMAYMGQRLTTSNTLAQAWDEVDENNVPKGDPSLWKRALVSYAGIGTIWTFKRDAEKGSIFTGGVFAPTRDTDVWVEDSWKIQWEAQDADHRIDHEQAAVAKREKDVSLIREALLPLRIAAHKRVGLRRYSLGQAVMAELHRPLTAAEKKEAGL